MKKALFILFVLAIGFALSACSKSSDASAEQKTAKKEATATEKKTEEKNETKTDEKVHKVGETFKASSTNFSVNKVYTTAEQGEYKAKIGDKEKTINQKEEFLIAEVSIENTSDKPFNYTSGGFELKDSKDQSIRANIVSTADLKTSLKSGKLASGKKVTGTVSFVIPKGEKNLNLSYNPSFLNFETEDITYLVKLN
ncbi:DUF4352 domain-containing protein [Bacillus subtilis]|uniref:DUF4352 domain-containing protein n=1 Tax=Bacillus subtilis TaxID=1423 RepID=UPI00102E62DA|nr:DUF4352 domain-containing protein [Bacillus subtilis]TAH82554.1 DUF4352 domain-containing protein [Bacillus subtilis]TAH87691.1 DUF4352 domain-containing protein [Bacillus subtilis]